MMKDTSKLLGAFAIGAMAGAALLKLLDSEQGKAFVEHTKEKASTAAEDLQAKIEQLQKELADLIGSQKSASPGDTV